MLSSSSLFLATLSEDEEKSARFSPISGSPGSPSSTMFSEDEEKKSERSTPPAELKTYPNFRSMVARQSSGLCDHCPIPHPAIDMIHIELSEIAASSLSVHMDVIDDILQVVSAFEVKPSAIGMTALQIKIKTLTELITKIEDVFYETQATSTSSNGPLYHATVSQVKLSMFYRSAALEVSKKRGANPIEITYPNNSEKSEPPLTVVFGRYIS